MAQSPELVVHLVHGTWGRGFFPRRRSARSQRKPLWFESGSPFTTEFINACQAKGIEAELRAFLWSGANSIRERDIAAEALCAALASSHAGRPAARQIVVAHSHGGNIALRALHRSATEGYEVGEVHVVALATPFIQMFSVDPAIYAGTIVRFALMLCFGLCFFFESILHRLFLDSASVLTLPVALGAAVSATAVGLGGITLIGRPWLPLSDRRDGLLELAVLNAAPAASARRSRLLVLRGIDDEALLTLAAGAMISKLSRFAMFLASGWGAVILFWIPFAAVSLLTGLMIVESALDARGHMISQINSVISGTIDSLFGFDNTIYLFIWLLWTFATAYPIVVFAILLSVCLAKSVFARELALGSFRAEIASNSVPDTAGECTVVTLPHHPAERHFARHALYRNRQTIPSILYWL